ncbi:MAG: Gfo/Idh/MocA family oxidoreductase [bacterium]|nr:Gfo/Idh/MocA family oxidoreductase [bacterium]
MASITRRQFVHVSAATAAATTLTSFRPARIPRRSPSEEIRVAVAGVRGRGGNHIGGFEALDGVRVVALCDPDAKVLANRAGDFEKKHGRKPDTAKDLRTLLDREDIDVVSIASPNHLHALQTVWSCQAGKDVYCEKPTSHNVWEGGQAVKAARKYERIVQAGTQSRSSEAIQQAIAWLQGGGLGEMKLARGLCWKPRQSIGKVKAATPIPDHIDYDLWCGPAADAPLMRAKLHYDWHWQFITGNGDLGNQGIHQMDICRWAVGADKLPARAVSLGGRFGYDDDGDTANTQLAWFDYAPVPILFEVRGLPRDKAAQSKNWGGSMDRMHGQNIAALIECEGGTLVLGPNYGNVKAVDKNGKEIKKWSGGGNHFANFIDAVKSRKREDQNADIVEGHLSSALCHMANDSYKLGSGVPVEAIREAIEIEAGADAFERFCTHLDANEVDLAKTPPKVGTWVNLDPETETYTDEAAKKLHRRVDRAPYVVPETV